MTNILIRARVDGPYDENALEGDVRPLKKQNLAQKWKHHFVMILRVCTNSPATISCQSSLKKFMQYGMLLGMT